MFFNFLPKNLLWHSKHFSAIKRGSPSSFLRSEQLNPKDRVFLLGIAVAKVTYCITIMITSCLEKNRCFILHHDVAVT